jgi:hypothetical protein
MLKYLAPIFLVFLILAIVSCDTQPTGVDGYKFGTPQYEKSSVNVNVVTYKTREEFDAAAKKYGVESKQLAAFSVLKPPQFDTCTIHMMHPQTKYYPEFIGHEFTHCLYGQWHTNNSSFE